MHSDDFSLPANDSLAPDDDLSPPLVKLTFGAASFDESQPLKATVADEHVGQRVDAYLAALAPSVSRSRIRKSIDAGMTTVDGARAKASHRVSAGERIEMTLASVAAGPLPEPIPLEVLFEDEALVVVNKPPGMVVHPAKGHWHGTLAGALVHRFGTLSQAGGATRPGIVHRLDRDTSGVIAVAKTDAAHQALAEQFQSRTVQKEYLAVVAGRPEWDADRVELAIGPHPTHREKMALVADHPESRPAETFFEVVERFRGFALMRCRPKTGRTHQIRLHLMHLKTPVLCDKQYGSRARITAGELRGITRAKDLGPGLADEHVVLVRQALHAQRLGLTHPTTGKPLEFVAPLPADMEGVLLLLRNSMAAR